MKKLPRILIAISCFSFVFAQENNEEEVFTDKYFMKSRISEPSPTLKKYIKSGSLRLSILKLQSGTRTKYIYSSSDIKTNTCFELNDLNSINLFLKSEFKEPEVISKFLTSPDSSQVFCSLLGDLNSLVVDSNLVY